MKALSIVLDRCLTKEFFGIAIAVWATCNYMPLIGEYIDTVETKLEMSSLSAAEYPAGQQWSSFKTAYFTVYYLPEEDLKSIERKLRTRTLTAFGRNSYPDNVRSAAEKITYRLDMLFIRTREILDMYPAVHVNIKIFRTRQELNDEYYKIYKKEADLPSFYVNKDKTIYVCQEDISDSEIVREMARAVVDQDLGVILPATVKNLFSSYVDSHLDE